MKLLLIVFLLTLLNLQTLAAENRLIINTTDPYDFRCEAVVEGDTARFYFLDERVVYKDGITWNNNSSSAIEFTWLVFFDEKYISNNIVYKSFDIGVRYYAQDGAPKRGSLQSLFDISDLHGFAYEDDAFYPINFNTDSLDVKIIYDDVVLLLNRNKSTEYFFKNPPQKAHFWVIDNKYRLRRCLAKVIINKIDRVNP